jgi:RNA polymerase sigma-70 factor (ECF subfamily)
MTTSTTPIISREEFVERALVLRCREGDDTAFVRIVELHHAELIYYVRALLGRSDGADDVVQEVWLAAFRRLGALHDVKAFRPWLYRIARNKAIDLVRIRPSQSIDDVREPSAAGDDDDDEESIFKPRDAARIHASLTRLSFDHREVLMLRFLKQMTYDQIAAVTSRDVGTVKSRLHYAKRSLRREMEKPS